MIKKILSLLISLLFFLSSQSLAYNSSSFKSALQDIKINGDLSRYSHLKSDILYPYLEINYYQKRLGLDDEIAQFLKNHGNIPHASKLYKEWVLDLLGRNQYQTIINNYTHTKDNDINCAYRFSLYQQKSYKKALHNIQQFWMSPSSLPDTCYHVFSLWGKANDSKLLVKRAKLAYLSGNFTLAQQLTSQANSPEALVINQFANYAKKPKLLLASHRSLLTQSKLHQTLLPRALLSLAKNNSVKHAPFILSFSSLLSKNKDFQNTLQSLTQYLAKRDSDLAIESYTAISTPSKKTTEELIFFLVDKKNWQGITRAIPLVTPFDISRYWLAKSLEKQQQQNQANALLLKLSKSRSYYGFLAADQLRKPYQFNIDMIRPNPDIQSNFDKNLGLRRALVLKKQSADDFASQEILNIAQKIDKKQQQQLAFWLHRHHLYFDAIYLLGKQKAWNTVYTRFPTPYQRLIQKNSQSKQIDLTWIYAIIRQETSMNPNAISRSKAKGLMQLIPSTANRMAKKQNIYLTRRNIFDPEINIALGSQYLKQMFNRYGNMALASAAYNAGPGRVDRWQGHGMIDMPLWIERIPFRETRKYVKRVLEYQQVYAHLLNIKQRSVTQIINQ